MASPRCRWTIIRADRDQTDAADRVKMLDKPKSCRPNFSALARQRLASSEIDHHGPVLDPDRVGLDVAGHRKAQRLAGSDVEAPGMERALDRAIVEEPVRQQGEGVRTDIPGGVEFALDLIDRNLRAADLDCAHIA